MPRIQYREQRFSTKTEKLITQANEIIAEYSAQGYDLTLRQLYYQFVSRDLLANTHKEYKRLGSVINDARLAGRIDWDHITDRTRNLHRLATWDSPEDIVSACASQFRVDLWEGQPFRVEVWIEKEALAGVFERVCDQHDVPFFSCRGYTSQSEMWSAAQRLRSIEKAGQQTKILHFGDHDPSGLDMTRDIRDRLATFGSAVELERLALNMDQIEKYSPPPNPAKATDVRADAYMSQYGDESWELDALEPDVLAALVRDRVGQLTDKAALRVQRKKQEEGRKQLKDVAGQWDFVLESIAS